MHKMPVNGIWWHLIRIPTLHEGGEDRRIMSSRPAWGLYNKSFSTTTAAHTRCWFSWVFPSILFLCGKFKNTWGHWRSWHEVAWSRTAGFRPWSRMDSIDIWFYVWGFVIAVLETSDKMSLSSISFENSSLIYRLIRLGQKLQAEYPSSRMLRVF